MMNAYEKAEENSNASGTPIQSILFESIRNSPNDSHMNKMNQIDLYLSGKVNDQIHKVIKNR